MKSLSELHSIKRELEQQDKAGAYVSPIKMLELVEQAIADRQVIQRWFGFLRLMALRSSWGNQINELLNEYLFGTENKEIQAAAKRYVELSKLHEKKS